LPANEPQLIGRSSEALPISDRGVSRRHAELTPDDGKWFLARSGFRQRHFRQRPPHQRARAAFTGRSDSLRRDHSGLRAGGGGRPISPVHMLDAGILDTTVEKRSGADESILAEPDPLAAAQNHLRIIYDLTALIASTTEREELLERIMDLIFDEFTPDRGFILLQEKPSDRPQPVVVRYKTRPKTRDEGHIPVSRTIIQHTLEHHEGVLSTKAMNDQRFRTGDSVREYGIRSAICVPMTAGQRTLGVIHIDSSIANFTFHRIAAATDDRHRPTYRPGHPDQRADPVAHGQRTPGGNRPDRSRR
jgi:hypothetical protein